MLRKILTSILLFALLFGNFFAPPKTVAGEVNTGVAIGQSEGNFDKFQEKLADNFCGEGVRDVASCSGYTLGQTVAGEVLAYGIGKIIKGSVVDSLTKNADGSPKSKPDTPEIKLDSDGCPISQKLNWWWEIKVSATCGIDIDRALGKVKNSISRNLKPDDILGAQKELRGEKLLKSDGTELLKANGKPFDHINEVRDVRNSLLKNKNLAEKELERHAKKPSLTPEEVSKMQEIIEEANKGLEIIAKELPNL